MRVQVGARITPPRAHACTCEGVRVRRGPAPVSSRPGDMAPCKALPAPARRRPHPSLQSLARERTHASAPEDVSPSQGALSVGKSGVSLSSACARVYAYGIYTYARARVMALLVQRLTVLCITTTRARARRCAHKARAQEHAQGTRARSLQITGTGEAVPSRKSTLRARTRVRAYGCTHARARGRPRSLTASMPSLMRCHRPVPPA
jgi:hypothetical protein